MCAWVVEGDELLKIDEDGRAVRRSAAEIFAESRNAPIDGIRFERFPATPVIIVGKGEGGLPTVDVQADLHGTRLPIARALTRSSEHIVVDNRWVALDADLLASVREAFHAARVASVGAMDLSGYLRLMAAAHRAGIRIEDRWRGTSSEAAAGQSPELPALRATLYPYQVTGFRWLASLSEGDLGGILGDQMGLGKTLQIIALLESEKNKAKTSLIVCPATLLENWRREIVRFSTLTPLVHQGGNRAGTFETFAEHDVVITSYDTATRDSLLLEQVSWNCLILDEAQAIKNPDAQRTQALKSLPRRVSIAVTGTPVENRLEDLWSLTDFALPGMLGSRAEFMSVFEDTVSDAQRLGALVSPVLLRRKVADVARDLPQLIDVPQAMVLPDEDARAYEDVRVAAEQEYGRVGGLVALGRLRMFCAHPCLTGVALGNPAVWPKYLRLCELLDEIFQSGEKVLVFSSYNGLADLFMTDLPTRFPNAHFDFIDGRVSVPDRQVKVDSFSGFEGPAMLALSPKAAGTGLNITAATHVIHYNPEWNPALQDQASARAYRRGQTRPVTVHRLYFVDTVEDVMRERLEHKRGLANEATGGNAGDTDVRDVMEAIQRSPLRRAQ